jgi:hypothetical protein
VQCIQSILVEVRSRRTVRFEWVHGHSGDRWNDVADELATLGQHTDPTVRLGCTAGRYAPGAPRTRLVHDPRTGGTAQLVPTGVAPSTLLAGCVPPGDGPDPRGLHRVTRTREGIPVGFSRSVFARQVDRLVWRTPRGYGGSPFSIRTARTALSRAQDNAAASCGAVHVLAARVAHACPTHLRLRWPAMWREGWSAPWPTSTTDRWWRMAAGGQYVSHQRRDHDPATAFCRPCATHQAELHLDTHAHLYYGCACQRPLWRWVTHCLTALGHHTVAPAAFMLYGTQVLSNTGSATTPAPVRRALSYVRAATIDGFYGARSSTMRPDALGEHPCVALATAKQALIGYVRADFFAATRAHKKHSHLVLPPAHRARGHRPGDIDAFAAVWHKFAGVRRRAHLDWLGPLRDDLIGGTAAYTDSSVPLHTPPVPLSRRARPPPH